ncbi:MAG: tRNA (adenosine(37)-N6)-threonylcarbamoyltransferase complex transferase subunit TsaD [Ktedonobacterales bacterium]|nr:tRNA (adenosine(37)-N6)-threonylcarbamoyltransferase complex transferase subunit TsaD [Ktedonobacterales bacterium]
MRVLAIESSCDETGAAVIEDGRFIHSSVVASQASIHQRYGGVVPEVASRHQLDAIIPVVETALAEAGGDWGALDAIAATYGPGLAGSLLIGLTAAKTLALARGLPFIGVNHLEAHIYANWLRAETTATPGEASTPEAEGVPEVEGVPEADERPGDPRFPLLALVVSGAHSELVSIPRHGRYELLGQTRDDAAGEAFDKVARILALGYPGGSAIERAAREATAADGVPSPYRLPRAWLAGTDDFSFSGLKTAVLQLMEGAAMRSTAPGASRYARAGAAASAAGGISTPAVAAAFQEAVVDVLATKTVRAAAALGVRQVVLAGGVAANLALRTRLTRDLAPLGVDLRFPPVAFCTDNAAMIGAAAYFHLRLGERDDLALDVRPNLHLPFAERA